MAKFMMIHDLMEENGKTIKENNLERDHQIPIGSLVEVKYDQWYGDGACRKVHARLWVVDHTRDCDGTPLYTLSRWKTLNSARRFNQFKGGFTEDSLEVIEVTERLKQGHDALHWDR